MKVARTPHRWSVTPRRAVEIQRRLAQQVRREGDAATLRWIAGTDLAFSADGTHCVAGVVLWDAVERRIVEQHVRCREVAFPYVPGLLSFRECPALLDAMRCLGRVPDALMADGHGYAHPRRFGLACHLGVILDMPVVGCAKSLLTGKHDEPGTNRGCWVPLRDDGEVIGAVVRTRDNVRPVFVSVGHRIGLESAVRLVLECGAGFRLPEPTRQADRLVARHRQTAQLAAISPLPIGRTTQGRAGGTRPGRC